MLCKSEWLWNQHNDKGLEKPTAEEATYAVACLVKVIHRMLDKKGTSKAASSPNKKVIITKTGKVIELSDESGQAPVKQQESGVLRNNRYKPGPNSSLKHTPWCFRLLL